jgi:hypothetical protein
LDMKSFLAGKVCESCNVGWMERLEKATRPIIEGLLDRKIAPKDLEPDELFQIAKWTVKTAIACNSALPKEPNIDQKFVRNFDFARTSNLGTCGIFAGYLDIPNRFGYIQTTGESPMLVGSQPAEFRIAIASMDFIWLPSLHPPKGSATHSIWSKRFIPQSGQDAVINFTKAI